YSRFWPRTSRDSFLTTVPAPWCGYTTLSPTLYKPVLPSVVAAIPPKEPTHGAPAQDHPVYQKTLGNAPFCRISRLSRASWLELQVPVDEVVLLEPPEALPDLPGS